MRKIALGEQWWQAHTDFFALPSLDEHRFLSLFLELHRQRFHLLFDPVRFDCDFVWFALPVCDIVLALDIKACSTGECAVSTTINSLTGCLAIGGFGAAIASSDYQCPRRPPMRLPTVEAREICRDFDVTQNQLSAVRRF